MWRNNLRAGRDVVQRRNLVWVVVASIFLEVYQDWVQSYQGHPSALEHGIAHVDLKASAETKWFLHAFAPVLKNLVSLQQGHEATILQAVEDMAELMDILIKEMSS